MARAGAAKDIIKEQNDREREDEEKVHIPPPVAMAATEAKTASGPRWLAQTKVVMQLENQSADALNSLLCPDVLEHLAPFARLQACLPWWRKHSHPFLQRLIQRGVEPNC